MRFTQQDAESCHYGLCGWWLVIIVSLSMLCKLHNHGNKIMIVNVIKVADVVPTGMQMLAIL